MKSVPEPLFLARESYRRRRLMDAARVLPVLGVLMFLVPVLWGGGSRTTSAMLYLFAVWALLILAALGIARALSGRTDARYDGDDGAA